MLARIALLAFACLLACVLQAGAEFVSGGMTPSKPDGTRPNQPAFGTLIANARPAQNANELHDLAHVAFIQIKFARRLVLVMPAPPAAPQLTPPVIKNPSNVPRQRR